MRPTNTTKVPFDTVAEEYQLAEIARSGDQEAAWIILESVLPYVAYIARQRALIANMDLLDLLHAGNEEMVARLENAIQSHYPVLYLKVAARYAISCYCIEYGGPIRGVPRISFKQGKRAPAVISLEVTPLDLLAEV